MFDLGFKFGCYISIKGIDEYDKVWWNRVVVSLPSRLSRCFLLAEKIGFIRLFRLYGIMRWLTDKLIFIIVSKTNESRAEYTFLRYVVLNFRTIFIIAGNVYRNLNNKFIEQISYKKLEDVRGGGIIISIDSLIFGRIRCHKVDRCAKRYLATFEYSVLILIAHWWSACKWIRTKHSVSEVFKRILMRVPIVYYRILGKYFNWHGIIFIQTDSKFSKENLEFWIYNSLIIKFILLIFETLTNEY